MIEGEIKGVERVRGRRFGFDRAIRLGPESVVSCGSDNPNCDEILARLDHMVYSPPMYKCFSCNKFATFSPGNCLKCGAKLQQAGQTLTLTLKSPSLKSSPVVLKKTIDEKKKSGTLEQLEVISVAYSCMIENETKNVTMNEKGELLKIAGEFDDLVNKHDKEKEDTVLELKEGRDKLLIWSQKMIRKIDEVVSPTYSQFAINLVLFDFRTAGGGRARKIANWLRLTSEGTPLLDSYLRPFTDILPHGIDKLLDCCSINKLCFGTSETISFRAFGGGSKVYIPPCRFTVSFAEEMKEAKDKQKVIEFEKDVKYAYMGSFGFSEPAYCTWVEGTEGEGNEYSGTRLSLGAYSLNESYLEHLLKLMRNALSWRLNGKNEQPYGYLAYGGARLKHVEMLLKVAQKSGHKLALIWAYQMVAVASVLVSKATEKARQNSLDGLVTFFEFVMTKIERRKEKLQILGKDLSKLNHFEYIWVQESSLWELAMLGATCLTLDEIQNALGTLIAEWNSTVGCDDTTIHEVVRNIPTRWGYCVFDRIYCASGSAAADHLHASLEELGYKTFQIKPSKKKLDPFIPYFEFYLDGGFLGTEKDIEQALSEKKIEIPECTQFWVNLSESLHTEILRLKTPPNKIGSVIAEMVSQYISTLPFHTSKNKFLVIDFTKFGGEMPNGVLYPILAELAMTLVDYKYAIGVAFLRSNLKYNTGTLDRYQSGEVLIFNTYGTPGSLISRMKNKAESFFSKGQIDVPGAGKWNLRGHYISFMKKVYLLSDAIGAWRWTEYVEAWKQ